MPVAGKVMPRPRGPYDPSAVYEILDMVTHNNKLWICKKPILQNVEPVQTDENWMLAVDGTAHVKSLEDLINATVDQHTQEFADIDRELTNVKDGISGLSSQTADNTFDISQLSNPNLLINPDFKINTSGKSEFTTDGFTTDKWSMIMDTADGGTGTITRTDDGVVLSGKLWLFQTLDLPSLLGTMCTATVHTSIGTMVFTESFPTTISTATGNNGIDEKIITYLECSDTKLPRLVVRKLVTDEDITIYNMKLELGSIATPFVPPNHDIELYKCIGANSIYSNPNLIINPDFKINQRGQSKYDAVGYGVDRWTLGRGSDVGYVEPTSTGLHIVTTGTGRQHVIQPIEGDFAGKTLTVSYKCSSVKSSWVEMSLRRFDNFGNPTTNPATSNIDTSTDGIYSRTFTISEDYHGKIALLTSAIDAVIEWVKLEYGSVATPFIEPNPTTELLKCQRYYYTNKHPVDDGYNYYHLGGNVASVQNSTYLNIGAMFPVPMRTTPTVRLDWVAKTTGGTVDTSTLTCGNLNHNGFTWISSPNNAFSSVLGTNYYVNYTADAEIYS